MLQCPKCGFNNELGRIFCHQCGNKLDIDKIKPASEGARMRRRVAIGAGRFFGIVIELVIAGALLMGIVLMCIVPDVRPVTPTNADLIAADTKRMDLDQLVSRRKPGKIEITEGEVNAFFHSLSFDKPKATGVELVPLTLRADFRDGSVVVSFLGELHFGQLVTKRVYLSMSGTPTITKGGFDLTPTAGRIGSLPLPAKFLELTDLFQKGFGKIFSQLDAERQSLDKLSSITVTPHHAVLNYEPAAK